ncbi:MAG TPA: VWA domain-containing protein [Terriglobales bacterium]
MHKTQRPIVRAALIASLIALGISTATAQSAPNSSSPSASSSRPTSQPAPANAPAPDKPADVSVKVNVVNALATVRDKHGALVKNLTKDDFILTDNGSPQTIHYFSQESNLPLTLGLLVDTSLSQRNVLDDERTASYKFLDQMLKQEKDVAFLIHFDREVELLQDVTSSRPKLEDALHSLQIAQSNPNSNPNDDPSDDSGGNSPQQPGQGRQRMHRGGTELYDAIYLASNELMSKQQGRKALIVLTDGEDRGSKETLLSAIEAAQRADTVIYSIYFKDKDEDFDRGGGGYGHRHIGMGGGYPGGGYPGGGYPGGGGGRYPGGGGGPRQREARVDGKKILEQISKETGGRLFEVSKKDTVEQIYSQVEDDLRNQYDLGFTPTEQAGAAGYHKIQLTTKKKDLTVQTRDGYYADR